MSRPICVSSDFGPSIDELAMEYLLAVHQGVSNEILFNMKEAIIGRVGVEHTQAAIDRAWETLKMVGL